MAQKFRRLFRKDQGLPPPNASHERDAATNPVSNGYNGNQAPHQVNYSMHSSFSGQDAYQQQRTFLGTEVMSQRVDTDSILRSLAPQVRQQPLPQHTLPPPPLGPRQTSSLAPGQISPRPSEPQQRTSDPAPAPLTQDNTVESIPDAVGDESSHPKILCLDGGGVRGYSEIIMLAYLMDQLHEERGYHVEPWQEFDMMVGTSTGGLLAIMLGRLRMSVEECKKAYSRLMGNVFQCTRDDYNITAEAFDETTVQGKFNSTALEEGIKQVLGEQSYSRDVLLLDKDPQSCKVVVTAVNDIGSHTYFRSFRNPKRVNDLLKDCQIWEAARATSATSTFFDPVQIGPDGRIFSDGGLLHNNPINVALSEARDIFPNSEKDLMFVSLGTGVETPSSGFHQNSNEKTHAEKVVDLVVRTEHKYQEFARGHPELVNSGRFYRFNVPAGLAKIGLDEHQHRGPIVDYTNDYCGKDEVSRAFSSCATRLHQGGQRLHLVGGERLQAWRIQKAVSSLDVAICHFCRSGIKYNSRALTCLLCQRDMCASCHVNHNWAHRSWILGLTFFQWQPNLSTFVVEAICQICQASCKTRKECKQCSYALCFDCSEYTIQPRESEWFKHATETGHREQVTILPPGCRDSPNAEIPQDRTLARNAVCTCDKCFSVLQCGSQTYECFSCRETYKYAPHLCHNCYTVAIDTHESSHRWRKFQWTTYNRANTAEDETHLSFQCAECSMITKTMPPTSHQHANYTVFMGSAVLEQQQYKLAVIQTGDGNLLNHREPRQHAIDGPSCMVCISQFAFDERLHVCLVCTHAACDRCFLEGLVNHRHGMLQPTMFRKVGVAIDINVISCDGCGKRIYTSDFIGLRCATCGNRDYCIECIQATANGQRARLHNGMHGCRYPFWHFVRR